MIVVVGEALADLVPDGADHLTVHCGGSPFNTARALARLGQPVSFLGCISEDSLGNRLRAALSADGVSLGNVVTTPLPTTLAFAQLDGSASASYRFYTEGTSAPSLDVTTALAALPGEFDALHFGSLGLMLAPLAEAVTAVVAAAASRRALTVLDPNVRPSLIGDRPRYLARLERVLSRTDLVKASVEDLAWLEPGIDPKLAAQHLLDRGPRIVIVTRGADGATVVSTAGAATVRAPRVTVVDTIGAGDAFSAGFLAWWRHRGLGSAELPDLDMVAEAARFACLVASRTVERPGASPPNITL
ncbi:MAG TPA: carbohydrate kinase [Solirubrobacteraceae bacterium]|nr:carbohydrate kinase [Solirubrobacteraceae bacterium]